MKSALNLNKVIFWILSIFYPNYKKTLTPSKVYPGFIRVSVQGVKSLGGHFACLCRGFEFFEEKKILLFFKKKMEILLHFNNFYSEKSSKRAK